MSAAGVQGALGGMDEEPSRAYGMGLAGKPTGDIVGVCYRLPDQEEVVAEAAFRQLEETSCLQALALVGICGHQRFLPASSIL